MRADCSLLTKIYYLLLSKAKLFNLVRLYFFCLPLMAGFCPSLTALTSSRSVVEKANKQIKIDAVENLIWLNKLKMECDND